MVAHLEIDPATLSGEGSDMSLPTQVSFDGALEMAGFRGTVTAHIVKLEDYTSTY